MLTLSEIVIAYKKGVTSSHYCSIILLVRDVAQFGSALPWGGRGRGFESRRSDHLVN